MQLILTCNAAIGVEIKVVSFNINTKEKCKYNLFTWFKKINLF